MQFYNPYEGLNNPNASWQKTGFHIHAGVEKEDLCGIHPMADVVKAYEDAGYDAIAVTNHDCYIPYNVKSTMNLIDGLEYSYPRHTLLIGINHCNFEGMSDQEVIDFCLEQGGIAVLAHPSYRGHDYWENELMDSLKRYVGVEVIRAPKRNPAAYDGENGFSVEKWDWLLSRGHRVYGFGNDDLHYVEHVDGGFNMIYAVSASFDDLKDAINAGCFYASTGVALESFELNKNTIKVKAKPKQSDIFTYRFIGTGGKLLMQSTGAEAEYTISTPEKYVRVEAISSSNEAMFLQPIFIEN